MKKSKLIYNGRPVFYDERNGAFVEAGKSRIYLNGETVKKIESVAKERKKKEKKKAVKLSVKKKGTFTKKK